VYTGKRHDRVVRIQEIAGSNLGPKTGYPEGFRGFSQSLQANSGIIP
jgi:hypothetical protein